MELYTLSNCCYSLVPAAGGELRVVQLMFNTTYTMIFRKKKKNVMKLQSGRNGVQMFNTNMAQFSSSQCLKSTLVYIIMCITEERAPYSPTFLTDG
jgi:hypothetical protein